MAVKKRINFALTLIVIYYAMFGLSVILVSVESLGEPETSTVALISSFAFGVLAIAACYSMVTLKRWGWFLTLSLSIFVAVYGAINIIVIVKGATNIIGTIKEFLDAPIVAILAIAFMAFYFVIMIPIPIAIIAYLSRQRVKGLFLN
ncbi:MAG: hypothetical protein ACE5JZ_06000 [Kiloniellales bacterium]